MRRANGSWSVGSCVRAWAIGVLAVGLASEARGAETIVPIAGEVPADGLDHFFVEFDVPEGIVEIEIRHDDLSSANILDWGLDDPQGFRGWGGGNSEPAVVGLDAASRGYVPGPIEPGTWRVVVGKAKIEEAPGEYAIEVVLRDEPTLAPQPERAPYVPAPPLVREARWYAGDFHVHSNESGDSSAPLDDILDYAQSRGLDFVAITDHNVHTATDFFVDVQARHPDTLLVPAVEYTTYAGHANAIGAVQWVDHKIGQPGVTIQAAAQQYRDAGAIFSLNHPTLDLGPLCIGCAWGHELDAGSIDAVEIANGGLMPIGGQFTPGATALWDELCAMGVHAAALGGSDDHDGSAGPGALQSPIGDPTTLVFAEELSAAAILDGIRASRTVVKLQGPDDPMLELWPVETLDGDTVVADIATLVTTVTGGRGQKVRLVQDGSVGASVVVDDDPFEVTWEVVAPADGQLRVRAEVLVDNVPRVVTSHVWIERDSQGGDSSGGAEADTGDVDTTASPTTGTGPSSGPSTGSADDTGDPEAGGSDAGGCGCRSTLPVRGPAGLGIALVLVLGARRRGRALAHGRRRASRAVDASHG